MRHFGILVIVSVIVTASLAGSDKKVGMFHYHIPI